MQIAPSFVRPTALGDFRITTFQKDNGFIFALTRGNVAPDGKLHKEKLLVRIQSACLFGESFAVNSCDCGAQLQKALEIGAKEDNFLLIYHLDQEGRGLGMDKKVRVIEYEANNQVNMYKAFEHMGYDLDVRHYDTSAEIIRAINGDESIVLLTNNPKKVDGLEKNGIIVAERKELLIMPSSNHDPLKTYLQVKKKYMGHILPQVEDNDQI